MNKHIAHKAFWIWGQTLKGITQSTPVTSLVNDPLSSEYKVTVAPSDHCLSEGVNVGIHQAQSSSALEIKEALHIN